MSLATCPFLKSLTDVKLDYFEITDKQTLDILHSLKVNKSHGPDDISVNMIKLCGDDLVVPLKLILSNVLVTRIFPDQ